MLAASLAELWRALAQTLACLRPRGRLRSIEQETHDEILTWEVPTGATVYKVCCGVVRVMIAEALGDDDACRRAANLKNWRRGWESNPRIKVLQTSPLPLGYRANRGVTVCYFWAIYTVDVHTVPY